MKTVLIIEDEKEICENIKFVMERTYKVYTSFSGNGGLDILKKESISLVVLDYMLPDIDGLEVLRNIKENYKIPVILITAHGDKKVALKSMKYFPDCYFDKPFSLKDLIEKVRELLKPSKETLPSKTNFPFKTFGLDPSRLSYNTLMALEFIGSKLSNPKWIFKNITLKEVSESTSVSPKYLSSLFKKECRKSISEIIAVLKREKAKELLDEGKDIKEISNELGYSNPNNFTRFIKTLTGNSPSVLRKKIT